MQSPQALTDGRANDQLLYFTSSSLTADDRTIVFISDRDSAIPKESDPRAAVNLYALDRASGAVRRLTDNEEGYLRSYVYFEGLPYRGLGLASPCPHARSGDVYYLQGREVRCVNAHTGTLRTLATLPGDQVTGFTHVSDDNARLCVPTIHESAFADVRTIDATVQRLGLSSHLQIFDTRSGAEVAAVPVPRGWVTHVQFQPGRNDVVLFNHEWPADCGVRRIWLWDGATGELRRLRPEGLNADGTPRRKEDWVCHEVWTRDGAAVVYHGTYAAGDMPLAGRSFVGRVSPSGEGHVELPFASGFNRYGHFTLAPDGRTLVSDGYAEYPELSELGGDQTKQGRWISLLHADWERGTHRWTPLCRHGSSWGSQDAHPHPIFNHAGTEVLFTSDCGGKRAIYRVEAAMLTKAAAE